MPSAACHETGGHVSFVAMLESITRARIVALLASAHKHRVAVVGDAMLDVYLRLKWLPIYGTLWILFIAYLTRYMPYGMRYAATSMFQIGKELEESAQMSGAGWFQTFRRIVLPLLVPGFVAGWIYIFVVSFRELGSSVLLYSPGKEVLSIAIWQQWQDGLLPQLSALGVMLVGFLVVMVAIAYKLGARIGVRET